MRDYIHPGSTVAFYIDARRVVPAENQERTLITRRGLLGLALSAALAPAAEAARGVSALKAIQKRTGGRLGVHVLDTQSGKRLVLDDKSRYAMASTFKLPLAAALLWQVDHGAFPLLHPLAIDKSDLLPNSPILEKAIEKGATELTVRDLCGAAVAFSDNAAANILLKAMGGPDALTRFVRSIGDETTRFDRFEPDLNSNLPGDERDTTTPYAMVESMLRIFTQDVLSFGSRALLIDWMTASKTGADRVRKGLPKGWVSSDKTGTGANGAVNDLVMTWPLERRPIIIAVYMSDSKLDTAQLSAAQAEIGQIVGREKWP
jgi:beta-lactamase class A